MSSLNKACLLGNVGQDPEIRSMNSGDRVANLSLATSERWTDRASGEKKEKTEWHRITVWGPLVDVIEKYVNKGDKLYLEGRIEARKWQDQAGADRYSTEVVLRGFDAKLIMLSPKGDGGGRSDGGYQRDGSGGGNQSRHQREETRGYAPREDFSADLDDEIPF